MAAEPGAPLISVIVPCYNAAAYLTEAIESVLSQEPSPLEVIVIDDGSTDGSAEVVRRFGEAVRSVSQANAGIAAARNRGVELARGRYLAFLDADDVWPAGSLAQRLATLHAPPAAACVFGAVEEFISPELDEGARARLCGAHAVQPARLAGTMLIEREAFLRVGLFDPRLTVGETLDWVARAEDARLPMRVTQAVVLRRRIHRDNAVRREKAQHRDYLRVLRASLARRRTTVALCEERSKRHEAAPKAE